MDKDFSLLRGEIKWLKIMFGLEKILAIGPLLVFAFKMAVSAALSYAAYWVASQFASSPDPVHMPKFGSYPVQGASKGGPIPKVYGQKRLAGNIIWAGDTIPYTIKHEIDAGGKGGGGDDAESWETRYRKSFLIAVCEGPASILKAWKGKNEISISDFTWFEGDGNSGIRALTGEDYGDYPNMACAFFEDYDLGNAEAVPNFTFEVASGPVVKECFIGADFLAPNAYKVVCKTSTEGSIDTTWGESGFWGDMWNAVGTNLPYDILRLDDGRILVIHDQGTESGQEVFLTMIKSDGTTDTTWGTDGHFLMPAGLNWGGFVYKVLQDSDGNFHIFGGVAATTSYYTYFKISEDGDYITGLTAASTRIWNINDAVWADANKTRIIIVGVCGYGYLTPGGWKYPNMVAIDPSDGTIDTTWTGNVSGHPGYTEVDYPMSIYYIKTMSDGGFVVFQNDATDTLIKILADGSGVDTSWGDSGSLDIGSLPLYPHIPKIAQYGDNLYTLTCKTIAEVINNTITSIDSTGTIADQVNMATGNNGTYHCIQVINNKLILGTTGAAPANYNIEFWSVDLQYESGFDITGVNLIYYILPDAATGMDVNPWDIIRDLVENNRYGAGRTDIFDSSYKTARDYWGAENMLISITIDRVKPWQDWVDYILCHVGGLRFNSGGKLRIRALKSDSAEFALTADDIVQPNPDAETLPPKVNITKRPLSDTFNRVEVNWTDRDNKYYNAVAVAYDPVDQARTGTVRKKCVKLSGIHNGTLAKRMAYRFLIDGLYRFDIYKFSVTFANQLIENMDVGTITDGQLLDTEKIRIIKIEEDENGRDLAITAMDDYAEHYPEITYSTQGGLHTPAPTVTLADVTVNFREDTETNRLYLSVTPGNAYFTTGYVYRSYDNVSYDIVGQFGIDGVTGGDANSSGTITESLAGHGSMTWSKDQSVLVSIGTVTDLKTSITEDEFWHDRYLAKIGDEIIAFKSAEETATPGIWRISNLRRGLFGTEPAAHSPGESFCTLVRDHAYSFGTVDIGQTMYFKVIASYGDNYQLVSDVTAYSVTVSGHYIRPGAASLLRLSADENDGGDGSYSGSSFTLYWNNPGLNSGWNVGGWDVSGGGVPWNNYVEDTELQGIVLKFEQADGTPIGQREIAVAESATITKATDLGGFDNAVIRVVPRRLYESRLENPLEVTAV